MSTASAIKRLAIVRSVPIDPNEAYDLIRTRQEHLRADVWEAVSREVQAGDRYVVECWEDSRATCYEYGVRFVRVPDEVERRAA